MTRSGKKVKNDDISRAVLRSCPPHAEDVPSMVDYYQKYGGGVKQTYVKNLCNFVEVMNISPTTRISGRHFEALGKLTYGLTMPSSAVTAVLKRLAYSKKVVDDLASDITVVEVKKFDTSLKDKFLDADRIIKKIEHVLRDTEHRRRTTACGWLEMTLIDHMLERPNRDGKEFKDMEAIAAQCLKDVFGQVDDPPVASIASGSSSSQIVQYDENGEAVGVAKMVLTAEGRFAVGENYALKGEGKLPWKLISMDDEGKSTLQAYSNIGTLVIDKTVTITGADLAAKYIKYEKKFSTLVAYPSNEGKHCKSLHDEIIVGRVKECLMTLARTMTDHPLTIRLSPTKGVVSKSEKEIAAGTLRLSPVTPSVSLYNAQKKGGALCNPRMSLKLLLPDETTKEFAMGRPVDNEEFCSAYFVVAVTNDEGLANMELKTHDSQFILASTSKLRLAGHEHTVSIPILVNKSIIKQGEELLYFVPKEKIVKAPAVVPGLEFKPNKRAKI